MARAKRAKPRVRKIDPQAQAPYFVVVDKPEVEGDLAITIRLQLPICVRLLLKPDAVLGFDMTLEYSGPSIAVSNMLSRRLVVNGSAIKYNRSTETFRMTMQANSSALVVVDTNRETTLQTKVWSGVKGREVTLTIKVISPIPPGRPA